MPRASSSAFRRYAIAATVLLLSLGLTLGAWWYVEGAVAESQRRQFQSLVQNIEQTIYQQWERYTDALRSTRGFWYASDGVTRGEWRTYIESLRLREMFPGIQGIGFAERVQPGEVASHEKSVRGEGFPAYQIRPGGERDVYFPIRYLEPFDMRNQRAFGYDMFAEPVRREAMLQAGLSGEVTASGRVTLVQETEVDVQPGLLVYVPVYRKGAPLETAEQRWQALLGFVYSPYRAHNLIRGMLAEREDVSGAAIAVYDGAAARPEHLLFETRTRAEAVPELSETLQMRMAGRLWTMEVKALPKFASRYDRPFSTAVLLGGVALSLLLGGMMALQASRRSAMEKAAEALRQSEQRFRLKIEQSPLAVQLVDPSGHTTYVNPAWQSLWNVTLADVREHNMLTDPQLMQTASREAIRRAFAGESAVIEPIFYDPMRSGVVGRARWVRTVLYATRDAAGSVREIVVMQEDYTQRKQAEEELRKAKETAEAASRAKDQFLALLSHELRNPLAPVLTMVDVLETRPWQKDAEASKALEVIRRNVILEARLIDDLLDLTRITRGKLLLDLEIVDGHTVLQHAVEICHADIEAKRLRLDVKLEATSHALYADPARLQQVYWNLIKNAVKFTPDGGHISIRTANVAEGEAALPALPAGAPPREPQLLRVEVEDNGLGIEPDAIGRIFNAFDQASPVITKNYGGLGLGLTISKALVSGHGGAIAARSAGRHRGAMFTIWLPVVAAAAPAAVGPQPALAAAATTPLRILLVEDLADARRALQMILRKARHEVVATANVQETLAAAQKDRFDVLLSDLGLPDGSGYDLPRQIAPRQPGIVAIAISGLGMDEDVRQSLEAGFQYHLTKPVQYARLQALLEKIAGERRAKS